MRFILGLVGMLAIAATLTACKSAPKDGEPAAQRPASPTGLPIEPDQAARLGYLPGWAADLAVERRQDLLDVVLLDEQGALIVTQGPRNLVSSVAVRDGSLKWTEQLAREGESLYRPLAAGEEQVFVNTQKRVFLLNAKTGKVEAISLLGSTVAADPALYNDYAIFGGNSGNIFAHDIRAGYTKWEYTLRDPVLTSPVMSGNSVFAADSLGTYALVDAGDGTVRWRNRTWGPVSASPAVALDTIYVASRDRSLYAINRISGEDQWIYRTTVPLTASPIPRGPFVFQPIPGQGLHAINAQTGKLAWVYPDADAKPIRVADGEVLMMLPSSLQRVDAEDGSVIETVQTRPLFEVIPGPDDSLLLITPGGKMLRINPIP